MSPRKLFRTNLNYRVRSGIEKKRLNQYRARFTGLRRHIASLTTPTPRLHLPPKIQNYFPQCSNARSQKPISRAAEGGEEEVGRHVWTLRARTAPPPPPKLNPVARTRARPGQSQGEADWLRRSSNCTRDASGSQ